MSTFSPTPATIKGPNIIKATTARDLLYTLWRPHLPNARVHIILDTRTSPPNPR